MSIHLVGGGVGSAQAAEVYGAFVAECAVRGSRVGRPRPRIAVLGVGFRLGFRPFAAHIRSAGDADVVLTVVPEGGAFDTTVLSDVDGLVVAGGATPHYLTAVAPLVDQVRLLVADALPYLGYSAGAMIAADRALLGGWRIGGVPVCPERANEGLDEVVLAEGLGLVDLTIDVHAVQSGTLARLVAAAEAGFVTAGLAIDEDTVLIVGEGALEVRGTGSVWRVVAAEESEGDQFVSVATLGA
ncbi:Type 1 glutamine amidotransferase-like domain-containing protein [Curtobacterium sp. RRHDQ10]|uniref:Type 1 glutamine amidotransferase-like domain-containing protein n=1 Tax=Curtobacterium phyllosphaerae TaxID=3413379 RepID=UPI003BF01C1F